MFCGFTVGSALGGLIAAQLLPLVGWRGVLCIGGVAPLLLAPLLALALPESLALPGRERRDRDAAIARIAARIAPALASLPRASSSVNSRWPARR